MAKRRKPNQETPAHDEQAGAGADRAEDADTGPAGADAEVAVSPPQAADAGPARPGLIIGKWAALLVAIVAGLALHLLRLITRMPYHDEHVHLQFLWLTSQGILPRDGFLCPYPPTAYYLFGPLLDLLPQKPGLFVFLRLFFAIPPLVVFAAAIGAMARHLGRQSIFATGYLLAFIGAGYFTTIWQVSFDLTAWALGFAAFFLLLRCANRWFIFWAATLATLSVLISPKHVYFIAAIAALFAIDRAIANRAAFARDVLAALGGAATPLLLMTLLRPAFFDDAYDLALLNYRTQQASTYPDTLYGTLIKFFVRDPVTMSVIWLGPLFFFLQARGRSRRTVLLYTGALAGGVATIVSLPCGYDQYLTLVWAIFTVFIPWMSPSRGSPRLAFAVALFLAATALFHGARELAAKPRNIMARTLRFQAELQRLCPPGEVAVAGPPCMPWFRQNSGYVFIDNVPSYGHFVRPSRRYYFSTDYYRRCLEEKPPAILSPIGAVGTQLKDYNLAVIDFVVRHEKDYTSVAIPCTFIPGNQYDKVFLLVRNDLVSNAVTAVREPFPAPSF